MKWIYGSRDWKTFERGLENCYLLTNGLGGFSSLTMTGAAARNDHALFMACEKAPNCRYNMIHRLREKLTIGKKEYAVSSQEFSDGGREEGFRHLLEFRFEDTPVWKYQTGGVEIEKEIAMQQGENTVGVIYRIQNRSREDAEITITPFLQFVPKGEDLKETSEFTSKTDEANEIYEMSDGIRSVWFMTNGTVSERKEVEQYYYRYDACDGRRKNGRAKACVEITEKIKAGESKKLAVVFATKKFAAKEIVWEVEEMSQKQKNYRKSLVERSGLKNELAKDLVKAAEQFVSDRVSTGNKTILAGYPFFEDWGRDTMIALPGICISTRQYEVAKSILRTFAEYESGGLMPNLFPEGGNEPLYNTVDAALLFINAVWLYYEKTGDKAFVKEMYPVMERIMEGYKNGTKFHIYMDKDGLICAGAGLEQVTWMDVRVEDILPTPRHGKPVEINAYWYNALRIMERLGENDNNDYGALAEKVKEAFCKTFWMEKKHCLKDVISGTKADEQIRCNQIWAVSMPFTMLDKEKERQIVDTVFEKLYTPYGLRTLEMEDPQFHPVYTGEMKERDLAYHQGTTWVFPLGAYYLAYLKVHDYSAQAVEKVEEQLEIMESAMREGCIGQLPEIYDGEIPVASKGCFAQAWSVGEILRVFERMENPGKE